MPGPPIPFIHKVTKSQIHPSIHPSFPPPRCMTRRQYTDTMHIPPLTVTKRVSKMILRARACGVSGQ
jgi:hypothetical protein